MLPSRKFGGSGIICRNILDVNPADAEVIHLIGMIADRVGMHNHAARYFLCALSTNPNHAARDSLNSLRADALLADARALQISGTGSKRRVPYSRAVSNTTSTSSSVAREASSSLKTGSSKCAAREWACA
jgi:hypothetical protein